MNKVYSIIIICMTIVTNICVSIAFQKGILRHFNKWKDIEKSLGIISIFQKYIQSSLLIISVFIFAFSVSDLAKGYDINKIYLITMPFIYLLCGVLMNQVIYHKIFKEIRGVETTLYEEITTTVKSFLYFNIPLIIFFVLRVSLADIKMIKQGNSLLLVVVVTVVLNAAYPYMLKRTLNAMAISNDSPWQALYELAPKHKLKDITIYKFPSSKGKVANALVAGIITKRIFLGDYLLEHLTLEEVEAILVHEIGHVKKFHLWVRVLLILLAYPLFAGIGEMMDKIERDFYVHIPIPIGIAIILLLMLLYFCGIYLLVVRIQEKQADEYVIDSGIDTQIFSSALMKIAKLNNESIKISKGQKFFRTHPSFEERLNKLDQKKQEIQRKMS